jgi:cytochrome c-type biogenesis protein CcmE
MLQKKVKKRASLLTIFLLVSALAIFVILKSLDKNILYFKSPTDIKISQDINFTEKLRVGGMVKGDSVVISEEEIYSQSG